MRKSIIGLMAIMFAVMFTVPAFAASYITVGINANGVTTINEYATVSGFDWSERSWEETAGIAEDIMNVGQINMVKNIYNPGQWELWEAKSMSGTGYTTIVKEVAWWTEDSTVDGGYMKWPTIANIYVGFQTATVLDQEEVHNMANAVVETAPGEFSFGSFVKNIQTDDEFSFAESVGIGMPLDCQTYPPIGPSYPYCPYGNCV